MAFRRDADVIDEGLRPLAPPVRVPPGGCACDADPSKAGACTCNTLDLPRETLLAMGAAKLEGRHDEVERLKREGLAALAARRAGANGPTRKDASMRNSELERVAAVHGVHIDDDADDREVALELLRRLGTAASAPTGNGQRLDARSDEYVVQRAISAAKGVRDADENAAHLDGFATVSRGDAVDKARADMIKRNRSMWARTDAQADEHERSENAIREQADNARRYGTGTGR